MCSSESGFTGRIYVFFWLLHHASYDERESICHCGEDKLYSKQERSGNNGRVIVFVVYHTTVIQRNASSEESSFKCRQAR